jgi:phospholipase/carboxylesterase
MANSQNDPHEADSILNGGTSLVEASGVMILLHGRGGLAAEMIGLGREISPQGITLLAPQAAEHTWYPNSFLAPLSQNEPWLTSALNKVQGIVEQCAASGVSSDRVAIVGFSQGACLGSEFVARHPRRYAAVVAFTGGLIGPLGSDLRHPGSLNGTMVLLSSGDPDPHVPWTRVEETAQQLRSMRASVQAHRFPGRPHTVLPEELNAARSLLGSAFANERADSHSRTAEK